MTAAELDALTAPLFTVWPECRPKALVFVLGTWSVETSNDRKPGDVVWLVNYTRVFVDTAAALIRVAIEDEMVQACGGFELSSGFNEISVGGHVIHTTTGPTLMWVVEADGAEYLSTDSALHALVAAALAVAEARK